VYYTAEDSSSPSNLESRVSRFTVVGDPETSNDADEGSEAIFYAVDQPDTNHNGGTIAIRDGWLYLALGDGGGGGDPLEAAQNDASPLGKMLRFDLDDTTPPWTPEQWAKGFRNPFRFSFDRETGDLYLGDVGQDSFEEIDVEPADSAGGLNYGWDVKEGSDCFDDPDPGEPECDDPSLVDPVFEYPHSGAHCSGAVIGGAVYRGSESPAMRGLYFFADQCRDQFWTLRWNPTTGLTEEPDERTGEIDTDVGTIASVTGIGEDGAGELYFVDSGGEIFRLVPEPGAGLLGAAVLGAILTLRARRRS
jgi:glucose/arabinose dehydrogenase